MDDDDDKFWSNANIFLVRNFLELASAEASRQDAAKAAKALWEQNLKFWRQTEFCMQQANDAMLEILGFAVDKLHKPFKSLDASERIELSSLLPLEIYVDTLLPTEEKRESSGAGNGASAASNAEKPHASDSEVEGGLPEDEVMVTSSSSGGAGGASSKKKRKAKKSSFSSGGAGGGAGGGAKKRKAKKSSKKRKGNKRIKASLTAENASDRTAENASGVNEDANAKKRKAEREKQEAAEKNRKRNKKKLYEMFGLLRF